VSTDSLAHSPDLIPGVAPPGSAAGRRRPRGVRLSLLLDRDLAARSEAELIAQVLAGAEPAAEVVRCGQRLAELPFWQRRALGVGGLVSEHGIRPERAVRLAALWELAERWYPDDRPTVSSPRDALLLLEELRAAPTERVVVLLLDARHRPLRTEVAAVGTINASRLQARDVLVPALRGGAAALIVAHNHPSGDPAPSRSDRQVTAALREASAVVGIPMLDHVIVTRRGHFSFREAQGWEGSAEAPTGS
jgi:DNA repair protein RadC